MQRKRLDPVGSGNRDRDEVNRHSALQPIVPRDEDGAVPAVANVYVACLSVVVRV